MSDTPELTEPEEAPEENKPATRIGLRGHEDDPAGYDFSQPAPAAPNIEFGAEATVHSEDYLKPNSTKPDPSKA